MIIPTVFLYCNGFCRSFVFDYYDLFPRMNCMKYSDVQRFLTKNT